jgi:hypothetical protein
MNHSFLNNHISFMVIAQLLHKKVTLYAFIFLILVNMKIIFS